MSNMHLRSWTSTVFACVVLENAAMYTRILGLLFKCFGVIFQWFLAPIWVVYPLPSISGTCWLQLGGPRCSKVWFLMDFGSRLGSLWGHFSVIFWRKGSPFYKQFCRSLLERLRCSVWSPKSDGKVCFLGGPGYAPNIANNVRIWYFEVFFEVAFRVRIQISFFGGFGTI